MRMYKLFSSECILKGTLLFKKFRLVIVLLFVNMIFYSGLPQTYEKIYRTIHDDFAIDAIELPDQSIIYIVNSGNFYDSDYSGKLFKVSSSGVLLDSVVLSIPNGYYLNRLTNIFSINESYSSKDSNLSHSSSTPSTFVLTFQRTSFFFGSCKK